MTNWKCSQCGLELDRSNEWEINLVDSHLDKHNREAN
jgi:hypothetical protein